MEWFEIITYTVEGGLLLILLIGITHRLFRDYLGKKIELEAVLVKKQKETYYNFSIFAKLAPALKNDYLLEFESNNKLYKFKTNNVFYNSAIEGQKVKIIFKGNRLINFEPV